MSESLYLKSDIKRLSEFNSIIPESFKLFASFDYSALAPGHLTKKEKELIAIAVAHITGCPYCIDIHTKQAKKHEATKEEVAESIMTAVALKAGSAAAHSVNALNAYDNSGDVELYKMEYFKRFTEIANLDPKSFKSFVKFDAEAMKGNTLNSKFRELIAVAAASTTGCPYCIEIHTKAAKKNGATKEELAESIMVATALKAGSAMAHGINMLNAFDEA